MLQDPVGSNDKVLFWVRVVIYPALIRPSLTDDSLSEGGTSRFSRWPAPSC